MFWFNKLRRKVEMNVLEKLIAGFIERSCKNYITSIIGALCMIVTAVNMFGSSIPVQYQSYVNMGAAIVAGVALILAKDSNDPVVVPTPNKLSALLLLSLVTTVLLVPSAHAQTGINFTGSTSADAVHFRGAWSAGATISEAGDVKDSTADANGNVNSLFAVADQKMYSGAGFTSILGGVEYVPTKYVCALFSKTNIPCDSFHLAIKGTVGTTMPTAGSNYVTGSVGINTAVALNNSGTVTWKPINVSWQNPGIFTVSSGLQYLFGGPSTISAQSQKARLLRKDAKLKAKMDKEIVWPKILGIYDHQPTDAELEAAR